MINETLTPNEYAPVVLFVFRRPEHTRRVLEALSRELEAARTDVYVYSDAPRNDKERGAVEAVRKVVSEQWPFRTMVVTCRETNWGLARNIISGVTEVVQRAGRVIVMEDDVVCKPGFLRYMNGALDFYEYKKSVWHVSGWTPPIDSEGLGDVFLWRVMNCWGWATWADRWRHYKKNPRELVRTWDKAKIRRFNLDGACRRFCSAWLQVTANLHGELDTWAIFWYAAIFEQGGLCVTPSTSLVDNIGLDGSGENTPSSKKRGHMPETAMPNPKPLNFPGELAENPLAIQRVKAFFQKQSGSRLMFAGSRVKHVLLRFYRFLK